MVEVITGAKLLELPEKTDNRGSLCFCETGAGKHIPFDIKRSFWVYGTPKGAVRGHHAHRTSWQAHVCLHGYAQIRLDNGTVQREVGLNHPSQILVLEPMIWHSFSLQEGSLLFVFTSDWYDPTDYVRDYDEFLRLSRK